MEYYIADQTVIFFMSIALGAGLGVVYDVFRIMRIAVKTSKGVVFAQDIVFFVIAAAATFVFLLLKNDGQLRVHILIGEFLGAVIYHLTLGAIVVRTAGAVIGFVKRTANLIYRIFIRPIIRIFVLIHQKISGVFGKVGTKLKIFSQNSKKRLKNNGVLLYNNMKSINKKKLRNAKT
ncbi:MAG: spore cortex biosynthesis protein YabQ [Oscillospiraceae bacterium]|nr:spore cortex biosynthesis protein YabQ [Oscillospiraceae bacterium]